MKDFWNRLKWLLAGGDVPCTRQIIINCPPLVSEMTARQIASRVLHQTLDARNRKAQK